MGLRGRKTAKWLASMFFCAMAYFHCNRNRGIVGWKTLIQGRLKKFTRVAGRVFTDGKSLGRKLQSIYQLKSFSESLKEHLDDGATKDENLDENYLFAPASTSARITVLCLRLRA